MIPQNPEDQPEFPVIERKYFVQFMFLEDQTLKYEGQQMAMEDGLGDLTELSGFPTERTDLSETAGMVINESMNSVLKAHFIHFF